MNLVINEVMELQHVFPADGDLVVQFFTGTAVIKISLCISRQASCFQCCCEVFIAAAVEYRGCDMDTGFGRFRHAILIEIISAVAQTLFHDLVLSRILQCFVNFFAEHVAGPGQVDFQNLSDVHSGWYA